MFCVISHLRIVRLKYFINEEHFVYTNQIFEGFFSFVATVPSSRAGTSEIKL